MTKKENTELKLDYTFRSPLLWWEAWNPADRHSAESSMS